MARSGDPQAKGNLQEYERTMSDELNALRSSVESVRASELLPLDQSYASIDRLEDFFRMVIDGRVPGQSTDVVKSRVERYLGQTLIKQTGAKWDVGRAKDQFPGQPCVGGLPGLGAFRFFPSTPAQAFKLRKVPGGLRDATERYDLSVVRGRASRQRAELDGELRGLANDVRELVGSSAALDFGLASIDVVEQAVKKATSRELHRRVRPRAALYIGAIVQRATGAADWTLCEDPMNAYFGHMQLRGWSPMGTVQSVAGPGRDGLLKKSVEHEIDRIKKGR